MEHYTNYGSLPDKETFLNEFPDFDLIDVHEPDKYLIETLQEQYVYSQMVPFVRKVADMVVENAQEAASYVLLESERIAKLRANYNVGYDLVKNSDDRAAEYKFRLEAEGLLGIASSIAELDTITHGWLKEDFIVIVGRTSEGKTWVLLFFLIMAWKMGVKVLLYSGEMSKMLVGFRFDTINSNFSNDGLMGGLAHLGTVDVPKSPDDYFGYLSILSKQDCSPFIVVTPKDIGGVRLTIPILHSLIEQHNPGIVGVDQLSLMSDYRASKGDMERIKFTHISEDLYLTSEKYGIPILSPAQSNRVSADKTKDKTDEATPELHEISESDGVPQNATRVIAIKQMGSTMKLAVKKNRYGKDNQEIMLLWDIDKGIVKPFLHVSTDKKGKAKDVKKITDGEDLF